LRVADPRERIRDLRDGHVLDVLIVAGGYVVGSMPFGYWLVRLLRGEDVRERGSGNIGATNVWRLYGRSLGLPIVLLDVAKGFVPALVGLLVGGETIGVLAGAAAMLGHWRPLFLGFQKGGKTVATAGGVTIALAPLVATVCVGVWVIVFLLSRYSSVASLATALALPVAAALLGEPWQTLVFAVAACVAVFVLHRHNIRRLLNGTESRFSFTRTARA
jgi:acyl phosphate:glycerol-3-phosphate acyltransferase